MENEKIQKELFEFEAPKKISRPRFGSFLQKSDFGIKLTAEKLVFISIGIIMLMVVFFALGVEKGKSLAALEIVPSVAPIQEATVKVQSKAVAAPITQVKAVQTVTNITPKDKNTQPAQVQQPKDKSYTIVAAAFSHQDTASREVAILKKGSLDAFVYYSEPYYLACVGSFANKDSAQKVLSRVRQMHRDAYVRLR